MSEQYDLSCCPNCGSDEITTQDSEWCGHIYEQTVSCGNCQAVWREMYKFYSFEWVQAGAYQDEK